MQFGMQLRQTLGLRLEQKLAPQLIQSMELLQLPMLELEARINQELQENPTLELVEGTDSPAEPGETTQTDQTDQADQEDTPDQEEFDKLDAMDAEWDNYFRETAPRPRRYGDDENDVNEAIANTAAPPETLQEHLLDQVRMLDLPDETMEIAEEIIYNMDDGGYLRYPLKEILESFRGAHTSRQAREALRIVQQVGPPGVGARDITECLLLQLDDAANSVMEKLLITFHLDDIQNNRLPKIAKDTGRTLEEVKTTVECISHLNPKPGEIISASHARYILPDMEVKYVEGRYEIALQDAYIPAIRISPYYRRMLEKGRHDSQVVKYVRGKIAAANWLLSSLEQRRDTLQRIGNEIVRIQKGFFEEGVSGLKPLRMQDVADVIGVHVATVSRATSEKYIDTPRGVYPLKFFFSGGLDTSDGGTQARKSVEQQLKQLIDGEDRHKPISDGELVKLLKEKGIEIARRTVAKYRNQLGIPSASLRKEH